MTATQMYLLEPLSQDLHFSSPFNSGHLHYAAPTSSTNKPAPARSQTMNSSYIDPDFQYQQDQRVAPRSTDGYSSHSANLGHANYYTLPAQPHWQQTRYPSGGSVDSSSSTGGADYVYQNNSMWQPSGLYRVPGDNPYMNTSDDYSAYPSSSTATTYPTASPASVPSEISQYSLSSSSTAAYSYSPPGSARSSHLALSMSPQQATISITNTPPTHNTSIPHSSSSSQGIASTTKKYSYREEYELFMNAMSLPALNFGPFVPQTIYKPHTTSDRKRYVEEVALEGPLYFAMTGPSEFGISLSDAMHSRVKRLVDKEKPVFEGRGPSVSIRLEWPGYRQWTRQIPTKDFRSPPGPITMAKLAKNIAKCVQRFIDENKDRNLEDTAHRRWKVGVRPHELKLDDLVLVSLHHVSLGSWQPHIRLRRPLQAAI